MRGICGLLVMLPAILAAASLTADDSFIDREEAAMQRLAEFKLQAQPTQQSQTGTVITLPPISIGPGSFGSHGHHQGTIFFFGLHGPRSRYRYPYSYGYPYYPYNNPYYAGSYGYGSPYPSQSPTITNTIYNTPGPTYSQQGPAYDEQEKEKDIDTERIDRYISDLTDEDATVRKIAVIVLAELEAKEAEGLLIDIVLNDEDAAVRLAAAEALGKIGTIRAIEPLHKAKKDEDKRIRQAAAKSLRKLRRLWAARLKS